MKEKIYTIPVNEAFATDCECPFCSLEKRLEREQIEYTLGASLMEPDSRIVTNEKGFCTKHYYDLMESKINALGLGLVLETHLMEKKGELSAIYKKGAEASKKELGDSFMKGLTDKIKSKASETEKLANSLGDFLDSLAKKCTICDKLEYTMDRYLDVFYYLWVEEAEFRSIAAKKKGYCLKHLSMIIKNAVKYLGNKQAAFFISEIMPNQIENLERIQEDISWYVKKYDYRYADADWKNSKDAIPRTIQKISGAL